MNINTVEAKIVDVKVEDVRTNLLHVAFDMLDTTKKAIVKGLGVVAEMSFDDGTKDVVISVSKVKEVEELDNEDIYYTILTDGVEDYKPIKETKKGVIEDPRRPMEEIIGKKIVEVYDGVSVDRTKTALVVSMVNDAGDLEQYNIKVIISLKEKEIVTDKIIRANFDYNV